MVLTALYKKKYFIYMIPILILSLLISGTALQVYADETDPLDQWYIRHDPELGISDDYDLWEITYGNGKFVATGDCFNNNHYDPILTSTDGANWEEQVSGVKGNSLGAVTFGNDKFVAVGMGGLILTSPDGETWTVRNQSKSGENSLLTVVYGNGTFVAAGVDGTIWTSPDGESWIKNPESLSYANISEIIYDKGTFVMVGEYGNIWTSTDGNSWTPQSSGTANDLNSVVFGNDIFLAVGSNGTILTSSDGVHWENHSIGGTGGIPDTSPGGAQLEAGDNLNSAAFGSGTFVAVSRNSAVLTSTDGAAWTLRNTAVTEELSGVAYGNYTFCITGGSVIFQSGSLEPVVPAANPTISKQPVNKTVIAGQTATFRVEAVGDAPISYRWIKDGADLSDTDNISGAAEAALTIHSAQEADEGSYTCYVSNEKGNLTSDAAALTVIGEGEAPVGNWSDYTGVPDLSGGTYTIDSAEELAWLASEINDGHNLSGYTFNVISDIDLSVHYWTPIGITDAYPFKGCFDGGGNTITGLKVGSAPSPATYDYIGLFGASGSSAQIENVKIADAFITACSGIEAGVLIGYNEGTIDNCSVTGAVEGGTEAFIGGLAGYNHGSISDSSAECTVNGGDGSYIGGFAGCSEGSIFNSRAECTVNGGAGCSIGGFVGDSTTMSGSISNCYATGDVTGGGATSEYDSWIGGFAGSNMSAVSNCYAIGNVTGGGVAAECDSDIGGFIGINNYIIVKNCYSTGNVTGGNGSTVGGFIGRNMYANHVNIYWNSSALQTVDGSAREENLGVGNGKDTTIGKTDGEMKSPSFTGDLNGGIGSLPAGTEYLTWVSDRCGINKGYPIFITDITPPEISSATVDYILNVPDDVSAEIIWNSAQYVTAVEFGSVNLRADDDYTVNGNSIILKNEFLSGLDLAENGAAVIKINFDLGGSVTLTIKAVKYGSDASLKELKAGGNPVAGFVPGNYNYNILLPYGTEPGSTATIVEAVSTDPNAHVSITQAASLPGDAVVDVTAEDGKTKLCYTVRFTLEDKPNSPPAAKSPVPVKSVKMGSSVSFTASDIAQDPDGDTLVITAMVTGPAPQTAAAVLKNGEVTITGVSVGSTSMTVTISDGTETVDVTIPVTVADSPTPLYALTVTAGTGGSITGGNSGNYAAGAIINITASADKNYSFSRWISTGGGAFASAASAATTYVMPANAAVITANFTRDESGDKGGSVNPANVSFDLDNPSDVVTAVIWNSSASITGAVCNHKPLASPSDYKIAGNMLTITKKFLLGLKLSENDTVDISLSFDTGNTAILTVKAVRTVKSYKLTVNAGTGGSIAEGGGGNYTPGTHVTIKAIPASGYVFAQWTSEGGGAFANAASAATTYAMPANAAVITANFKHADSDDTGGGNGGGNGGNAGQIRQIASVLTDGSGITIMTLPVIVDMGAGSAIVDLGTQQGNVFTGGEAKTITVPAIPGVDKLTLRIPADYLSAANGKGTLRFTTGIGSFTIHENMLEGIDGTKGKKAEISIGLIDNSGLSDAVKTAIGNRPLIQITLAIDGKQTDWNNPDAPVTVSIPYKPTADELSNPEGIIVWYIDGSGRAVPVPNGHYDPVTGTVTFRTTHFSYFAVCYNKVSFSDVSANAWYNTAVGFIASRGITTGTGNGIFSPEAKLTRAEFLVMIMRAYGISSDTKPTDNFADADSNYYTGYLAAAKRLGISEGIGNNMFAPDKEITRQEMFTMLYKTLKTIKELPAGKSGKQLSAFTDAGQIASWAKDAMTLFVASGTVSGNYGRLSPAGTTTRAEMAQALYNLLSE